jgi:hypothetical protein
LVTLLTEESFKTDITLDELKNRFPYIDQEILKNNISKDVKLTIKAWPKNPKYFSTKLMPKIINELNK